MDISDLADRAKERAADLTGKRATGFEASVCAGCPHRGGGRLKRCGLCGCPTVERGTLDVAGMTPAQCPRAARHERES